MRRNWISRNAYVLPAMVSLLWNAPGLAAQSSAEHDTPADIERFTQRFQTAVRAYDVVAWTDLVSDDVVMMSPNGRVVQGRDAFRALWARTFEGRSGPNPLQLTVREVRAAGELAMVRADYGPEGAPPVGQYVWLLERGGAEGWSLAWWIFNRGS